MTPSVRGALQGSDVVAVRRLADAATAADGAAPLNEATLLRLESGAAQHVLLSDGGELLAYAQVAGATAELVVHPDARGAGRGGALLDEVLTLSGRPLGVWAHGDLPAAAALARSRSLSRSREVLQLRRRLDELPAAQWPDGVRVRTYRPGSDDAAWLALNADAFAHHPEQGGLTMADLRGRQDADWFDPGGFFLAERAGRLVGFHWTKQHPGPPPVGEVYVLAVAPSEQGSGLGRALSLHGLHHLRNAGLPEVLLYVEADNAAAVAVYERLGFIRAATDVVYTAG